ncbi:hypothetical protein K439DRAFT_734353 [Ramaria rubella]|nr:hypothetical protein K439DRAFT_734353 [Ramaria rubella]
MLDNIQRHLYTLLNIVTLHVQVLIVMHAASVALLLHGVLLSSLLALIIRSRFSAETILLITLLVAIHPKLLSIIQITSDDIQDLSQAEPNDVPASAREHDRGLLSSIQVTVASEEHPPSGAVRALDTPFALASVSDEAADKTMEFETPTKRHVTRRRVRKNRLREMYDDDDKENEPMSLATATKTTPPTPRRHGLRPLTLTSLPVNNASGTRRSVSLFNGSKRLSPLFYVPDGNHGLHSPPAAPPADISARRASLPLDSLSRLKTDITAELWEGDRLTARLQDEMKLTARLRDDLVELRDRACAELDQSKQETQSLAVAIDARECFIEELAVSMELLRVENKVLKNATRRDSLRNFLSELNQQDRTLMEQGFNARAFSPMISRQRTRQESASNDVILKQVEGLRGLKSVQKKKLAQRCVKRSSIPTDGMSGALGMSTNATSDATNWFSLGSVSEPTLEPRRGIPSAPTIEPACDDKVISNKSIVEEIEVEFPTISPKLPPRYAAALACKMMATPSLDVVIYEVDGRALAASKNYWRATDTLADLTVLRRGTQRTTISGESNYLQLTDGNFQSSFLNAFNFQEGASALQWDSSFYAVPVSAFLLPSMPLLSGQTTEGCS